MTTIKFAHELKLEHCAFSIATPFPGTRYYEIAVSKGYLPNNFDYFKNMNYMKASLETQDFSLEWLKQTQYDANIRINFLENKIIYGDMNMLRSGLKKYDNLLKQYDFNVVAHLVKGYMLEKLGNIKESRNIFKNAKKMLEKENIAKAYSRYIDWDTPPTNSYRNWLESSSKVNT